MPCYLVSVGLIVWSLPSAVLKKHLYISAGGDVSALTGKGSPRPNRSSRPLSAVFQNIHPPNIWRHRKGTASFTQVHPATCAFLSLQKEGHVH